MTTRIRGVALAPGVSRNNRLYTREAIAAAVQRAQKRVVAGQMVMRSHHDAGDDTRLVVGRVTTLKVGGDGAAHFEAELADTAAGRDIAALVKGPRPFVDGVSIAGAWSGKVRRLNVAGESVETCDGLDIQHIDFTHQPGVDAARVVAESYRGKRSRFIFETAPGPVEPVTAELTARDLAAMSLEEFQAHADGHWSQVFAVMDEGRPPSPFWHGLAAPETT